MQEAIKSRINTILSSVDKSEQEEYLKNMLKDVEESTDENKDMLMEAINKALLDLEINLGKSDNENLLNTMQQINPELNRLRIVNTSKFENDSYKDISYLYYQDEKGETQMLELTDENMLRNFVVAHQDNYDAAAIFNYFKRHISKEVEFDDPEKEPENEAVVNDDVVKDIEMKKVEEYKNDNQLHDDIEVSVDSNGERLYKIGKTVLKFETTLESRELKVLETGNDIEEEMDEEEKKKEIERSENSINNSVSGNITTARYESEFNSEETEQKTEEQELTESEQLNKLINEVEYDITYDEFEEMVDKTLVQEQQCDIETHAKIIVFVKVLTEQIEEAQVADVDFDQQKAYIDYYMESIEPYYQAYLNGEETLYKLSEIEIEMIENYKKSRTMVKPKVRVRLDEEEKSAA